MRVPQREEGVKTRVSPGTGARRLDHWFLAYADLAALAVVLVGLAVLLSATRGRYLSPDEALHFELANQPRFLDVYRSSRWNAHPPLFFLILRVWLGLGHSESFLRLLPAVSSGIFLWFSYRWTSRLFGKRTGFLTLLVLALTPIFIPLSEEVRGYSLLLLLCAAALAEFELAIQTRSPSRMAAFSVILYLAILTHYSALFVTMSAFVYAVIRFRAEWLPRRVVGTWAVFQVGVAALYAFLYFTQVAALRGSEIERQAMTGWLDTSYFHRGREAASWFVVRQTVDLFCYLFGSPVAAAIAFLFVAVGVISLARKRNPAALLLLLPFLFGAVAGVFGLYPFGGTRHSSYLLPFAAAAIGVGASAPALRGIWSLFPATAAVLPLLWGTATWSSPPQSLGARNATIDRLRRAAPPGSLIFADYRTEAMLSYSLGRQGSSLEKPSPGGFWEKEAGSYCIVRSPLWTPDPKTFCDEVERLITSYGLAGGDRFWVVRWGLEYDMTRELSRRFPGSIFPVLPREGDMSVVEFWP